MTSKSYYTIAGSSFLLLMIGCPTLDSKRDEPLYDVVGADAKAADAKKADSLPEHHNTSTDDDAGVEPEPEPLDTGDTGDTGDVGAPVGLKGTDGCHKGEMPFEGICLPKDHVGKILDKREAQVMEKVMGANTPKQAGQAAYDLIEHQAQQMDKVEDDLDEIIQQLEREQDAKKKPDDGKGGLP